MMKPHPTSKRLYPHDVLELLREPPDFIRLVRADDSRHMPLKFKTFYRPNMLSVVDQVKDNLKDAVAFDFTAVNAQNVLTKQDMAYATDALDDGTFRLPFPVVGMLNTIRQTDKGKVPHPYHGFSLWLQSSRNNDPPMMISFTTIGDRYDTYAVLPEAAIQLRTSQEATFSPWTVESVTGRDRKDLETQVINTAYTGLAYFALLRWRTAKKIFTPAPLVPNQKRAKLNAPLIADRFTITIEPGHSGVSTGVPLGNTHASPEPHWRRAHTRTMASGLIVPVRESRVGFDEDPRWDVKRKNYEVKV